MAEKKKDVLQSMREKFTGFAENIYGKLATAGVRGRLSKKGMRLYVSVDVRAGRVRMLRENDGVTAAMADELAYVSPAFSADFFGEMKGLFADYFARNPVERGAQACLVLPNEAVGIDSFKLPAASWRKTDQAFEAELNNLFEGRQKEKKINRFLVKRNKKINVYGAVCFRRPDITQMYDLLADNKVLLKVTTYSGAALLGSALGYMPRMRGRSFVFANVSESGTEIVLADRGKAFGMVCIPHGLPLLRSETVVDEYMATDHELGEIAVINARESAKARSLTVSEETLPDAEPDEEEESGDAAEPDGAQPQTASARGGNAKVYRKTARRYPKFMQRPVPETKKGICFENFRIIEKWILLYARQAALSDCRNAPEFVLISLPDEFGYLVSMANEEQTQTGGLAFVPFVPSESLSPSQMDNLNVIGGAFADKYDRNNCF